MSTPFWLMKGVVFSAALALSILMFWKELQRRLVAVHKAKGPLPWDRPERRWARVAREVLLQSKVIRHRPLPGLAHAFLLWAFLAFGLESLDHLSHIWLPHGILPTAGLFHDLFQGLVALFAWAASAGILYLAFRRFVLRPRELGSQLSGTSALVSLSHSRSLFMNSFMSTNFDRFLNSFNSNCSLFCLIFPFAFLIAFILLISFFTSIFKLFFTLIISFSILSIFLDSSSLCFLELI